MWDDKQRKAGQFSHQPDSHGDKLHCSLNSVTFKVQTAELTTHT